MKRIIILLLSIFLGISSSYAQNFGQKGADIDGESMNDLSGGAISMPNSNIIAIGATGNDGNAIDAGHVRIFQWNGSA